MGCSHVNKMVKYLDSNPGFAVEKLRDVGKCIHLSGSLSSNIEQDGWQVLEAMGIHTHICIYVCIHSICVKQRPGSECTVYISTFPGACMWSPKALNTEILEDNGFCLALCEDMYKIS